MLDKVENYQKRKYIYFCLLILFCFFVLSRVSSRHAESLFKEVLELEKTGRYEEAFPKINRVVRLRPRNESYLASRAVISFVKYKQTGSEEFLLYLAIADWLRVIELKKNDSDWKGWSVVYRNLGLAYRLSGETHKSIESLKKALSYNTMDADLAFQISAIIGDLYFGNKDYEEAAGWYAKIPSDHGTFFHACLRNARCNHRLDNFERAEELYLKALENTMDADLAFQIRAFVGDLYFENKKYAEAADWYAQIPPNHGVFFHACLRNARCNHQLNNFERAEELYLKALAIKPDDPHLNAYIAHLYVQAEKWDKVIGFLQHGLKQVEDAGLVFATLGSDNFSSKPWNSDEYLKTYESFFDEFQSKLQSYAADDVEEDSLERKKLDAFYRSVNKVVVRSLESSDPFVVEFGGRLLEKIKQAGLLKAVIDDAEPEAVGMVREKTP